MTTRKLRRLKDDRWVAGVLSGLAIYFGHDPIVWRLFFIMCLVLTGFMPAVLIYVVAWVIIPPDDGVTYEVHKD